jgi:hypothetical protein
VADGVADVVYGSRLIGGRPHRILFFWHTVGNKLLTFLSNAFTNLNLSDMETCYKLFDAAMLKSVNLKEKRFGFEPGGYGKDFAHSRRAHLRSGHILLRPRLC